MSNIGNVIGGHKANLSNPNTSEEAKEHSRSEIERLQDSDEAQSGDVDKNPGNVAGGHKANLKNPNTSEESKEASKQALDNL